MKGLPPSVRRSARVYRWLVQAYPESFGAEYGESMIQVFTDMATEARQSNGLWGLVRMWFRVLADLAWSVQSEHAQVQNRRPGMKTAFYAFASIVLAMVVQYFVMLAIGLPILWVYLISADTESGFTTLRLWELPMFFLPPFFAAMVLVHTKPVYRPWLTAPLGAMAFFVVAFAMVPWWAAIAVIAFGGVLSLAGCYLGSRITRGQPKEVVTLSGAAES